MTDALPDAPPAESTSSTARLKFDWRLFAILWALNIVASLIAVPYMQAFVEGTSGTMTSVVPPVMMFATIVLIQLGCSLFWNGPAIALGMLAARPIGLDAPVLRALVHREPLPQDTGRRLGMAFGLGLIAGAGVVGLLFLLDPLLAEELARLGVEIPENINPPPWAGFLGSISAGVTEESLLRLFLLSSLAWTLSRVWRGPEGRAPLGVLWAANVIATLVFGALHFSNASAIMPLTPLVMGYVLTLNGLLGLLFGWLYWRFGLESAMMAHFSTDIILHVITPMLPPM